MNPPECLCIHKLQGSTPESPGMGLRNHFYKSSSGNSVNCVRAQLLQPCPTLCDPMDCSPPVFSVHGIVQARILEWVAMPSSRDLPKPGIEPMSTPSLALQSDSLPLSRQGCPVLLLRKYSSTASEQQMECAVNKDLPICSRTACPLVCQKGAVRCVRGEVLHLIPSKSHLDWIRIAPGLIAPVKEGTVDYNGRINARLFRQKLSFRDSILKFPLLLAKLVVVE